MNSPAFSHSHLLSSSCTRLQSAENAATWIRTRITELRITLWHYIAENRISCVYEQWFAQWLGRWEHNINAEVISRETLNQSSSDFCANKNDLQSPFCFAWPRTEYHFVCFFFFHLFNDKLKGWRKEKEKFQTRARLPCRFAFNAYLKWNLFTSCCECAAHSNRNSISNAFVWMKGIFFFVSEDDDHEKETINKNKDKKNATHWSQSVKSWGDYN